MEHFVASQVEITYVLALYPSIIVPKSSCIPEPQKFADVADAPYLSRGSSGLSDDLDSETSDVLESDEMEIESKKMSHNTLTALIKYLQKKRYSVIEKATTEGTEEVVSDAVGDNSISYGTDRSKKTTKGRLHIPITSIARDMAAILDTALLQALLLTGQSSAARDFLKSLNYCDVKICEEFLQERSQYACQLELYRCNSMHHEALKLLHQLVEESKSEQTPVELSTKFKPDMIIEYLKPLCATDPMLVLEFSLPVLESCPMQTIELFLSGNIPADLVNSYLKQHAPDMQATYLELMLAMNENSISENLQNEMVQIYLSEVLDLFAELNSQQKWDEKTSSPTRKKLLSALESLSGYNPELLLRRLPPDALYEERAILLGKMNQHELALSIYVHKNLLPFLGPLLRKSSEAYRNFSVIKSLRESENLQEVTGSSLYNSLWQKCKVKDELYNQRKAVLKITSDSMCSLCNKKIGTSVFAVYPNGKTIVHFVCFRDSQNMKAVGRGSQLRKR